MMWKKYNEIRLTKNEMDLNNQKIANHPPSPVIAPLNPMYFIPYGNTVI